MNGTSMATPHVAGIVSVIKLYKPEISLSEIKTLFQETSVYIEGNI